MPKKWKKKQISCPTNFIHRVHTDYDPVYKKLIGLPKQWHSVIQEDWNFYKEKQDISPQHNIKETWSRPTLYNGSVKQANSYDYTPMYEGHGGTDRPDRIQVGHYQCREDITPNYYNFKQPYRQQQMGNQPVEKESHASYGVGKDKENNNNEYVIWGRRSSGQRKEEKAEECVHYYNIPNRLGLNRADLGYDLEAVRAKNLERAEALARSQKGLGDVEEYRRNLVLFRLSSGRFSSSCSSLTPSPASQTDGGHLLEPVPLPEAGLRAKSQANLSSGWHVQPPGLPLPMNNGLEREGRFASTGYPPHYQSQQHPFWHENQQVELDPTIWNGNSFDKPSFIRPHVSNNQRNHRKQVKSCIELGTEPPSYRRSTTSLHQPPHQPRHLTSSLSPPPSYSSHPALSSRTSKNSTTSASSTENPQSYLEDQPYISQVKKDLQDSAGGEESPSDYQTAEEDSRDSRDSDDSAHQEPKDQKLTDEADQGKRSDSGFPSMEKDSLDVSLHDSPFRAGHKEADNQVMNLANDQPDSVKLPQSALPRDEVKKPGPVLEMEDAGGSDLHEEDVHGELENGKDYNYVLVETRFANGEKTFHIQSEDEVGEAVEVKSIKKGSPSPEKNTIGKSEAAPRQRRPEDDREPTPDYSESGDSSRADDQPEAKANGEPDDQPRRSSAYSVDMLEHEKPTVNSRKTSQEDEEFYKNFVSIEDLYAKVKPRKKLSLSDSEGYNSDTSSSGQAERETELDKEQPSDTRPRDIVGSPEPMPTIPEEETEGHHVGTEAAKAGAGETPSGDDQDLAPKNHPRGSQYLLFLETLRNIANSEDPDEKYSNLVEIGEGETGIVYSAVNRLSDTKVAIRKVPLHSHSWKDLERVYTDIMIMFEYSHRNILEIKEIFLKKEELWTVMEYMDGGSVTDVLKERRLTEAEIASICRDVLRALRHIHGQGFVHRDVRGDCILRSGSNYKLSGFGYTADCVLDGKRNSMVGSAYWMSPELLNHRSYGTEIDIWSLGITVIEMIDRQPPYYDTSPAAAMRNLRRLPSPKPMDDDVSPELMDFIQCMLVKDALERSSADELLKHQFLKKMFDKQK